MIEVGQIHIAQCDGYLFDRTPVRKKILGFSRDDFVQVGERRSARISFAEPDQVAVGDTDHTCIFLYGIMPGIILFRQIQKPSDVHGDFPAFLPF